MCIRAHTSLSVAAYLPFPVGYGAILSLVPLCHRQFWHRCLLIKLLWHAYGKIYTKKWGVLLSAWFTRTWCSNSGTRSTPGLLECTKWAMDFYWRCRHSCKSHSHMMQWGPANVTYFLIMMMEPAPMSTISKSLWCTLLDSLKSVEIWKIMRPKSMHFSRESPAVEIRMCWLLLEEFITTLAKDQWYGFISTPKFFNRVGAGSLSLRPFLRQTPKCFSLYGLI